MNRYTLDILGRELAVGDRVVYADGPYSDLEIGIVVKLTPKMVRVKHEKSGNETVRPSNNLTKIQTERELATIYPTPI
jgi:hypothetical protein